jgi:hypothetical protein
MRKMWSWSSEGRQSRGRGGEGGVGRAVSGETGRGELREAD